MYTTTSKSSTTCDMLGKSSIDEKKVQLLLDLLSSFGRLQWQELPENFKQFRIS